VVDAVMRISLELKDKFGKRPAGRSDILADASALPVDEQRLP
jgi:hypothetical protein